MFKNTSSGIRLSPPPGGKKNADWMGLRVRLVTEVKTQCQSVPIGAEGEVSDTRVGKGLRVTFDACPHCGVSAIVGGLEASDVEIIEPAGYRS
ncbi:hypothetical protein [Pararobbsia alpina]|uniref:Uncharacterized protein n=1 Tax=Pararobbsia alpina TaxID=621374 RepID=A0A6S7CPK3_9BURK|nr:hypothetical protein [Pararobbsia alpina]CAB3784675.1 hypothetical protein LMG28138_01856 [Pararobbsia alpina]